MRMFSPSPNIIVDATLSPNETGKVLKDCHMAGLKFRNLLIVEAGGSFLLTKHYKHLIKFV